MDELREGMSVDSDGELCESGELWEASVHEAGHVRIGQLLEGVQVGFARAKASGTVIVMSRSTAALHLRSQQAAGFPKRARD